MPSQRTFDGPDLEAALARIREEAGADARILGAERVRSGGLAGFFSRERYELTVEVGDEAEMGLFGDPPEPAAASILELAERVSRTEQAAVSTQSPSFAAVLEGITAVCGFDPAAPGQAPSVGDEPKTGPADREPAAGGAQPPFPVAPRPPVAWRRPSLQDGVSSLGLPDAFLAAMPGDPLVTDFGLAALLAALATLPTPPALPTCPGSVIAVVGERRHALDLAAELADDLGLDPGGVLLASPDQPSTDAAAWRHLPDAVAAGNARRTWHDRPQPTVVAVEASHRRRGSSWARHVLAALAPTARWALVDAGRKTEDVTAWADALGGVDALALHGVEETTTPAAVLTLGIPVARLDGRPATPAAWAAILSERLTA